MKTKIIRNLSSEAGRAFWDSAHKSAEGVREWPAWKKAGVTAEQPGVADASPTSTSNETTAHQDR
jgi:hypothetical protein